MSTEIQPGFSFNPGQLIPNAPLIFPGESELFQLLELTAEYAGYFGYVGEIIAVVAEIIVVILQLIDQLVSAFEGKPRAQDTLTVAKRLANGQSPIAHLMSTQITRNLNQNNIVLSSSDANDQKVLGDIRKQAELLLTQLGTTAARAKTVVDNVWNSTTSGNQKLPAELNQPIPVGQLMVGPQQLQQDYIDHYNARIKQGDDPLQAAQKATNWVLQHSKLGNLGKIEIRPVPLPTPPQPQTCPTGQHWDATQNICVPDAVTPPPSQTPCPPYTQLPDCLPQAPASDPNDDEIGDAASQVGYWIEIIAIYMMNLYQTISSGSASGGNDDCCTEVVSGLTNISTSLNAIATYIQNLTVPTGGTPVDLSPVVNALSALNTSLEALPTDSDKNTTVIAQELEGIKNTLTNSEAVNVSGIVDALKTLNDTDIAGKDLLDRLVELGVIDPQVGQILGDPVRVRIDPGRYAPETIKVLKYLSSVDTTEANRILAYLEDLLAKLFDYANNQIGKLISGEAVTATSIFQKLEPSLLNLTTHTSDWVDLLPKSVFQLTETVIENGGAITPDNAEDRGFRAFGFAWLVGQGIHVLADLAKFLGYPMSSLWSNNAVLLVELLAYEDIRKNLHGPYWEASIGANRKYQVNQKFRPYVPGTGPALGQYARRKITDTQVDQLLAYAGVRADYVDSTKATAFRPLNPRQLTNLYTDAPFDRTQVQTLLEDSGISDANIPVLLDAYEYKSVSSLRQSYVASVERSAVLGTITEAELQSDLTGIGYSNTAINLILLTVSQKRLDTILTLYRREIDTLYSTNQLTDAQYVASLTAAGMDTSLADGYYGIATAKLHGKELAATARAEAKLEAQRIRLNIQQAKSSFLSGQIDLATMTIQVTASGLDLSLVPMTIALFQTELQAKRTDAFGLLLPRNKAVLLREKVSGLKEQFIMQAIDLNTARSMLTNLNIPTANIEALLSEWQAQTYKTAIPV